jgi:diacylglycerol kinase (ATP)
MEQKKQRSYKSRRKRRRPQRAEMRLKIIVNPAAGRFKNALHLRKLQKYLRNRGVTNHIVFTHEAGDAIEAAKNVAHEGYDAVAFCGGDGTLREVIAGVIGKDVPIGIIPLGTGNVIAADLGIPKDPFKACDTIIGGHTRKIDVGKNGDSYFMIAAGAGYDCEVVAQVDLQTKSKVGRLAYIATGIKLLRKYKPIQFTIESEDFSGSVKAIAVVVINSPRYGGYFSLKKEAKIDDGLLDVIVVKGKGWFDILRIFARVLVKSKLTPYDIFTFRTKKVRLESEKDGVSFHNDSDVAGQLPQTFEIVEGGTSIFVPGNNRRRSRPGNRGT